MVFHVDRPLAARCEGCDVFGPKLPVGMTCATRYSFPKSVAQGCRGIFGIEPQICEQTSH